MGRKRRINIGYPLGGLDRKSSYRQQKPFTTPDCLNVRPGGPIEGRDRGGSRPGLFQVYQDDIGSNPRLLYPMQISHGTAFTAWSDTFGGTAVSGDWAQAAWASDVPLIMDSSLLYVDTSVSAGAITRAALPINSSSAYSVEMLLVPWNGSFAGKYQIYARMDNTTPNYTVDGIEVEIIMSGATGAYTGTLDSYASSVKTSYALTSGTLTGGARPVWLKVGISANTITVTLDGTTLKTQAVSAHTGLRVGCGLEATLAGGVSMARVFRVQYYSTGAVPAIRSLLVASAGGNIYKEGDYGRLSVVSSNLSVRSDVPLTAVQSGQKLYIADYGDRKASGTDGVLSNSPTTRLDSASYADWTALGLNIYDYVVVVSAGTGSVTNGTYTISAIATDYITLGQNVGDGNCTFTVERGPKVYDPIANTLTLYQGESNALPVPTGCPIIARSMDRIVLAGAVDAPNAWYMARRSDEDDFDYGQTDSSRAMAGTASDAGVPGPPIVAVAPYSDDYTIFCCRNQLWRLRGDPAYGGSMDNLSYTVGVVGPFAWCFGPSGEMIFMSTDGVYVLPPGGDSKPVSLSRESLPSELRNFNPDFSHVMMVYDVENRGVCIYISDTNTATRRHYFLDWEAKTWWPETFASDHEPTAVCQLQATAIEDSGVIVAGRDGILRTYSSLAEDDSGTNFTAYIDIGMIPLAADFRAGVIQSMDAVIATYSGDVTWAVYTGLTFEAAATSTSTNFTGTWVAGHNSTTFPSGRGQAFRLRLTGTAGRRWAVENIGAIIRDSGPLRKF